MKKIIFSIIGLLIVLGYSLVLFQYQVRVVRPNIHAKNPPHYYDYKGITSCHTTRSSGSLDPSEIISLARDLKFDFIFFTEVNVPIDPTLEGYWDNILVLSGGEFSYLDSRLIYYNSPEEKLPATRGQMQVYLTDILSQADRANGIITLAKPFHSHFRWSEKVVPPGLDAVEILNLQSLLDKVWNESKMSALVSLFVYFFNPNLAILRLYKTPEEELNLWDQENSKRKLVGLFGHDATAKAVINSRLYFKFPSYQLLFSIGANHLLLESELIGEKQSDRAKIYQALKNGQLYFSLDILADPKGFFMDVRSKGKIYPLGSTVRREKGAQLIVQLPSDIQVPFEVVIYRNGEPILNSNLTRTVLPLEEAGVYRSVVRVIPPLPLLGGKRWIPWVFTNPIFVK